MRLLIVDLVAAAALALLAHLGAGLLDATPRPADDLTPALISFTAFVPPQP